MKPMAPRPRQNGNSPSVVQGNNPNNGPSQPELGPTGAPIMAMSLPLRGRVPVIEWARRACFVQMISMSPGRNGSSRYVLGDAFMTIARKNKEIGPDRLVAVT